MTGTSASMGKEPPEGPDGSKGKYNGVIGYFAQPAGDLDEVTEVTADGASCHG